jgi:transcription antitermination factor NusG
MSAPIPETYRGQEMGNQLPSASEIPRWYAAYTNARHERRVAQQMRERDIEYFLPLYRSVRNWKDRRKELEMPLFPGYVFVRFGARDRLRVVTSPGVVQLVSFGGMPVPLSDAELEALRKGLSCRARLEPHPYLKVGRRVRVHGGPMAGVEGILVRRKEKFRVVLSIELIQRSVAVEVHESEIEPLAERSNVGRERYRAKALC